MSDGSEKQARWHQVDKILGDALDQPAAERATLLDRACGSHSDLRHEIESLLRADAQSTSFLENRTRQIQEGLGDDGTEVGIRIGVYRLIQKIGQGGMGTVFLATRDDRQYRKQVAIKLLRGGAHDDHRQRFRQERQTLALLEHANIARLHDGGVTDDGRPYLVMEYIDGLPLDRYCDQHCLNIDRRVELLCTICAAVSHAHRNLLVHRDLKPDNILVNAEGEPKLLDFGIAKLLAAEHSPEMAHITRTGLRAMSPAYASPEQVRGDAVTTASDVYSLGVVLFELLTGRGPYRPKANSQHELDQAILEQVAPLASSMIGRDQNAPNDPSEPSPSAICQSRGTTPRELRRQLRGDLDTIVCKALRKEPDRRYGSAQELADDLRHHLEHRPVAARPDTFRYRLTKLARRNPLATLAWSAAALLLIGISLIASTMAVRIARERDFADRGWRSRKRSTPSTRWLPEC